MLLFSELFEINLDDGTNDLTSVKAHNWRVFEIAQGTLDNAGMTCQGDDFLVRAHLFEHFNESFMNTLIHFPVRLPIVR